MLKFALKNMMRRPLRTGLTLIGLSVSVAMLVLLLSFGDGYRRSLNRELSGSGMQMMLVPLGCPYDAAAQVLKGRALDVTLPEAALRTVRADSAVAVAAPVFSTAQPRPALGRTDLWSGVDSSSRLMKPWWHLTAGSHWFSGADSVILGAEAAATELRQPGDRFYSPETDRYFRVCGVLERSGTSDDSQFFVPLATAQAMFHQTGKLTAITVRLKDPLTLRDASERLQKIHGAQVVTMSEMMGTFLNLLASAKTLIAALALIALAVSSLSIFNTMMAATLERTRELGVLRAVGFDRGSLFGLMLMESVALSLIGDIFGVALAAGTGAEVEPFVRSFFPLAPALTAPVTVVIAGESLLLMLLVGIAAGAYPAWQASRLSPALALRGE